MGIYHNNYAGSFNTLNAVCVYIYYIYLSICMEESSHLLGSFQILLESLKGAIEEGFSSASQLKIFGFFLKLQLKNTLFLCYHRDFLAQDGDLKQSYWQLERRTQSGRSHRVSVA